ncbi:MAG TPA: glycosyltransferase WbuB [Gammaproteobacteria bacterium]|nr:glycosyltransferase WbuB [Gammaproteobacteria bacterium]
MHILFLSHYFPPEVNAPASRTFEHCRQWVKLGHRVTVITCAPNHPRGQVYPGYRNRLCARETIDGVEVIRLWTYITPNEGFIKRTLAYISYMVAATFFIPFMPKADVVVTTSPQFFNGLAGYLVSRLKRRPWVLEIRDLWPESILAVGAIRNRTIIRVLEWLEMFAYRRCDHLVPVTDAFRDYMLKKGIPDDKITVVKNGVDLAFYDAMGETTEHADLPASLAALDGKFVAAYVGTHGMAHHLETVLEAAETLREHPNIVFLLVGEGSEAAKLRDLRDARQLDNVVMTGQLDKAHMPAVWQLSDLSLVLLRKLDLFKTVIPSKIFESMAMKKPIIIGVQGESQAIVEAAKAGVAIEPENAAQLAETVLALANDTDRYHTLASNGRSYVSEHFNRERLAARLLSVLQAVAYPKNPRHLDRTYSE